MNVLITGATGFIGAHLAQGLIESGHRVYAVVRPASDTVRLPSAVVCYRFAGEIEELAGFMRDSAVDVVCHLASLFVGEHRTDQVIPLIESNLLFGAGLLEAMALAGVNRMINTGTSWQHYDGNDAGYRPVCLYAATKESFEKIIDYYVQCRNFRVITLKLFDTYGPGDPRKKLPGLLRELVRQTLGQEVRPAGLDMSGGEQEIDLVHVDDVVRAYQTALNRLFSSDEPAHEIFGIGSGTSLTLRELVGKIQELAGVSLPIRWGKRPYRAREVFKTWKKYHPLPGWKPVVPLEAGLQKFLTD